MAKWCVIHAIILRALTLVTSSLERLRTMRLMQRAKIGLQLAIEVVRACIQIDCIGAIIITPVNILNCLLGVSAIGLTCIKNSPKEANGIKMIS